MLNIKVDWLQIVCYGRIYELDCYKYEYSDKRTKEFRNLVDIFKNEQKICTIAYNPISPVLKENMLLIKFDNSFLYSCNIINFAIHFYKIHNFEFGNITRLDLCTDFNFMYNNLKPQCFIKGVLKNKYLANMRMNERFEGVQKKHHTFHYLKYGSHSSIVSSYLYNKTKEMNEKTWKPYIYDSWLDKGLICDIDVWRLEFSIHPSRFNFIPLKSDFNAWNEYKHYCKNNAKVGNLDILSYNDYCIKNNYEVSDNLKFDLDYLSTAGAVNAIFQALLDRYFHFKINKRKRNKSENPDKQLFLKCINTGVFYINDLAQNSDRSDKIFLNKLAKYEEEIQDKYPDLLEAFKFTKDYVIDTRKLNKKK